ncbi:MAG: aminotransferase class I/II-fold pyridoxal phosphate-dependent enzyme, partial [Pseudomonadota bacterium]
MARAAQRDHGGGIDAAIALHGGERADWLDLSTGINPRPYPLTDIAFESWTALPDARAMARLVEAARRFWQVPDGADILAAPGASALIAQIPYLAPPSRVRIAERTYNEHAASFRMAGWEVTQEQAEAVAIVHPNNPDGTFDQGTTARFLVIDESFCDIAPERSRIKEAALPGRIILKSFGKFWGLAGLRLGFVMAEPPL